MLYPMHTVSAIATPRIAHLGSAARARNTRNLNGTENEVRSATCEVGQTFAILSCLLSMCSAPIFALT